MQTITIRDLGLINYADALDVQTNKFNELVKNKWEVRSNADAHYLYLCEHPPVITLGKAAKEQNILLPKEILKNKGIDVVSIQRGGDVTLHDVGQITGYPILDLEFFSSDLKKYMRNLEEVMIRTIAHYGIDGYRIEQATGVWVNSIQDNQPKKIAAFGVKTSRWITMHGFALNVHNDLNLYQYINPCGFTDKGVTSIQAELEGNKKINIQDVKHILLNNFSIVFNANLLM